jgi:hypothetical protein
MRTDRTAAELRESIRQAEEQYQTLHHCDESSLDCQDHEPALRLLRLRIEGMYQALHELEPDAPAFNLHRLVAPPPLARVSMSVRILQTVAAALAVLAVVMHCTGTIAK